MVRYEKLDTDSDGSGERFPERDNGILFQSSPKPAWKIRYLFILAFTTSVFGLLTTTGMLVLWSKLAALNVELSSKAPPVEIFHGDSHENHPHEDVILDCGETRGEAMARGCSLDVMADAWLPQACYYEDFAKEAMLPNTELTYLGGAGPFEWFLDANHTQPVAVDSLKLFDELTGYTFYGYHVAHCIYDWRVSVKAWNRVMSGESPVYVHSKILDEEHIHHCGMVMAGLTKLDGAKVEVHFGLGECVRLDEVVRSKPLPGPAWSTVK